MRHGSINTDLAVLTIVAIVTLVSIIEPQLMTEIRYYFLAASMLLIGIPHGAIDHIISSRIYNLKNTLGDQLKFYVPYLLLMIIMALIWMVSGIMGFLAFAIITMYHFGQADLEHLQLPKIYRHVLTFSRGLMILSLIIFMDSSYTFPVIEEAAGISIQPGNWLLEHGFETGALLALQHPLLLLTVLLKFRKRQINAWWYPVLDALLIFTLFALNDPIIAFSIYFSFWHSMGHLFEMKDFFKRAGDSLPLWKFYKLALPFTLISLAGLWLLYLLNTAIGMEERMVALLFILISVLTLPHVFVVEKMLSTKS